MLPQRAGGCSLKAQIPSFLQTNENMELADAIQSEQHVKKELARRMGELQEELHNTREQVRSHTHSQSHSMTNTIGGLLMNFCVGEFVGFCPFSLFHCAILSSLIFFSILVCFMHNTALAQAIYDNSMQKEIK